MLNIYEDKDYYTEDGSYITTPEIDTCGEVSLGFVITLMGLILPMIGVFYGL